MLVIRLSPEQYEELGAVARAARMSRHAFSKGTLLARLRRLRGDMWGTPRPHRALAADLHFRLAAVEALSARRMTVAVRCDELAQLYRDMLRALEESHA